MKTQLETVRATIGKARWAVLMLVVIVSTLALSTAPAFADATSVVTFNDPILEAAVAAELNVPAGSITQADMDRLNGLSANRMGIQDLTGLEYAHNMYSCGLQSNNISDVTPLSGLSSLRLLYLGRNRVSDLTPIADLQLTLLDVEGDGVSDLTPLAQMTSLTQLWASNNQIVDISPLAELHSLSRLSLTMNRDLADFAPLSDLTSLTLLGLGWTQLGDAEMEHLSNLTSLTNLDLQGDDVTDLQPLAGLVNLTSLCLNGNHVADLSPVAGLTSLASLGLVGNEVSDISDLVANQGLGSGDRIDLTFNHLDTTSGSSDMADITTLLQRGAIVDYRYQTVPATDVTAPITTVTGTDGAWHNHSVTLTFSAQDNAGGSGVSRTEYSVDGGAAWSTGTSITVSAEGTTSVRYRSVDQAGNVETANSVTVKVDTTPPVVTFAAPADQAEFVLGQAVTATWTVADVTSGVATSVPAGTSATLDTTSFGAATFTVSATDQAGNTASATVHYTVAFATGGLMQPVNSDGSSVFKSGSNVPLKFAVTDASGQLVTGLTPRLYLARISADVEGTEIEAVSSCQADSGNIFRETNPGQYQFNLSTKGMLTGYWRVRVDLGDGAQFVGYFSLR